MSETPSSGNAPDSAPPVGDPWAAFGYLVAGVLFYGVIGWAVSLWLHASFWFPAGVLVGAAFGMYLVFSRYRFHGDGAAGSAATLSPPTVTHTARLDRAGVDLPHDVGRFDRPASDDQGETL